MNRYIVVSYADTSFLQLFLWERLKSLGLMPAEFEVVNELRDGVV